jgi:hypothetical protein
MSFRRFYYQGTARKIKERLFLKTFSGSKKVTRDGIFRQKEVRLNNQVFFKRG